MGIHEGVFKPSWLNASVSKYMVFKNIKIIWYHLHVESKIWHQWIYLQNRKHSQNRLVGESWIRSLGLVGWKLSYIKCTNNDHRELNSISYSKPQWKRIWKRIYFIYTHTHTYIYNWITLLWSNTILWIKYTSVKKINKTKQNKKHR